MSLLCPICEKKNPDPQFIFEGETRKIKVLFCDVCDFHYLDIWDDVDYVKSLYAGSKDVFTNNISEDKTSYLKYDEYEDNYKRIKPYLKKNMRLLEIGCGDGKFLHKVKNDVQDVECVELSEPQVNKLRNDGFICYDQMIEDFMPSKKYDVICLFAVLEHVPNLKSFLNRLKLFLNEKGLIFIGVPNSKNVLFSGYEIEKFKNFYYRSIHLYYFNPFSLSKILNQLDFKCELTTSQQASITNHFNWIHLNKGQKNANEMTSVKLPVDYESTSNIHKILDETDDFYRSLLEKNNLGDLLFAKVSMTNE